MGVPRVVSRALAVALALAAAALAGGAPAEAQSRQETLILASSISDYITNDPSRTFEFTSQIIDRAAYDTLVTVEPPDISTVRPRLATSWEISKDGTAYTFKLRPGVKFSSGNPLTAQDVRFSLRRLKHLKDQPSFFMDPVKDVQVVNDGTVRIVLNGPDASFLAALACVPCGIVDSKTVMAHGGTDAEDAKEKDKATEWLNQNSAGTGPFRLVSFVKDVEAVLERNPGHWGPKPYFAKIIFKHVASAATQREMVERGDADIARDIDPDTAATIKEGPRIKVATGVGQITDYERMVLTAAARAHKATGVPITTHTDHGTMGREQLDIFTAEGVDPRRVVIGHSCGSSDLAYHVDMLDRCAYLGFDRFGLEIIHPDRLRTAALIGLLGVGFENQIMLSHDSVWCWLGRPLPIPPEALGKWNPTHVFKNVIPALREAGVSQAKIDAMLVGNPGRYFAGS